MSNFLTFFDSLFFAPTRVLGAVLAAQCFLPPMRRVCTVHVCIKGVMIHIRVFGHMIGDRASTGELYLYMHM